MLVTAVQMTSGDCKRLNLQKAIYYIEKAAGIGASLVALPEMFNYLGPDDTLPEQAETIPGPTTDLLAKTAKTHKIFILAGSIPEISDSPNRVFNTSILIHPEGKIQAKYRKIHLMNADFNGKLKVIESAYIESGHKIVCVETDIGKIGLTICYDLRFPELYRRLMLQGAQIVFAPSAFTNHTGQDHWESIIRARAIENQFYIVAPDQFGFHSPNRHSYGKSIIVDPWGNVIAKASDKETLIYGEIDLNFQKKIRSELPSLLHRREDIFNF